MSKKRQSEQKVRGRQADWIILDDVKDNQWYRWDRTALSRSFLTVRHEDGSSLLVTGLATLDWHRWRRFASGGKDSLGGATAGLRLRCPPRQTEQVHIPVPRPGAVMRIPQVVEGKARHYDPEDEIRLSPFYDQEY